jgi:hypothetical protein
MAFMARLCRQGAGGINRAGGGRIALRQAAREELIHLCYRGAEKSYISLKRERTIEERLWTA